MLNVILKTYEKIELVESGLKSGVKCWSLGNHTLVYNIRYKYAMSERRLQMLMLQLYIHEFLIFYIHESKAFKPYLTH